MIGPILLLYDQGIDAELLLALAAAVVAGIQIVPIPETGFGGQRCGAQQAGEERDAAP